MSIINLLFIPYRASDAVVIPKNLVEYVLPYAPPLPTDYQHPALVGSLIYQNEKVPVIDLALLHEVDEDAKKQRRRRIVIVSSIIPETQFSSYAIIASDAPRVVTADRSSLTEVEEDNIPELFYSKIQLSNELSQQFAYVPALAKLETALFID